MSGSEGSPLQQEEGHPSQQPVEVICVENTITGKKYKVSAKHQQASSSVDDGGVASSFRLSNVTTLTLKKNFATLLKLPLEAFSVAYRGLESNNTKSQEIPVLQFLRDEEAVPLGVVVLLIPNTSVAQKNEAGPSPLLHQDPSARLAAPGPSRAEDADPVASSSSSAISTSRLGRNTGASPMRGPAGLPLAPSSSMTTNPSRMSTPQKQQLLDLARQIFDHQNSELGFRNNDASGADDGHDPRRTTPSRERSPATATSEEQQSSIFASSSSATASLRNNSRSRFSVPRPDDMEEHATNPLDESYGELDKTLTRRPADAPTQPPTPMSSHSDSGQNSLSQVADDGHVQAAQPPPPQFVALEERCKSLEHERDILQKQLSQFLRASSSSNVRNQTLNDELDEYGGKLPAVRGSTAVKVEDSRISEYQSSLSQRQPVVVVETTRSSRSASRQGSATAEVSPVKPSSHLTQELLDVQRKRRLLKELREAKATEHDMLVRRLQHTIQNRKATILRDSTERISQLRLYIERHLPTLNAARSTVAALQQDVSLSDQLADSEKAKVDEATKLLDSCKARLIDLLDAHPVQPKSDDGAAPPVRQKDLELAQFIASTCAQKNKHLVSMEARRNAVSMLRQVYEQALMTRKHLHHQVEDAKGNIRVVVRLRPKVPSDDLQPQHLTHLEEGSLEVDEERHVVYLATPTTGVKRFEFYGVYGPSADSVAQQGVIFDEQVKPLLTSVLDGVNVAVLAYGPTGSGKTFSILGKTENGQLSGLFPQSVEYLLETIPKDEHWAAAARRTAISTSDSATSSSSSPTAPSHISPGRSTNMYRLVSCDMTMVEVYMDQVFDILGQVHQNTASAAKVELRQGSDFVSVSGATEVPIHHWEDAVSYIQQALRLRRTHKTLKNLESSRSHLMVTLNVTTRRISPNNNKIGGGHGEEDQQRRSKLVFVDLAGSERVSKSLSQGDRLKEAQHINKSLSALGDVVHALSSKPRPAYIPYRNSRLTQLLYDAIGGNAKTLVVTCICPHLPQLHNLVETQSALQFASRVKTVRNALTAKPSTNV